MTFMDMEELWTRQYPVGNDDFVKIRKQGQLYVDKTELLWRMINLSEWIFLSRPRRFGKTLIASTLQAYFEGRKELFEGLAIAEYTKEWVKYPVLRFNLSVVKDLPTEEIQPRIGMQLKEYEAIYGRDEDERTPGARLSGLIKRAYKQTGLGVVLIFDEYDAPLLGKLGDSELLDKTRTIMQEFYTPIKACSAYERFTFITGITKFSQLSIFSTLNNLNNISMLPQFAALTGFTDEELDTYFHPDIERLGRTMGVGYDEIREMLRKKYDGYYFTEAKVAVYNPFSLLSAFANQKMEDYWFKSGTPTFIFDAMQKYKTDITTLEQLLAPSDGFDVPTESMTDALPLLYQSGYLTIKDYDPETYIYTLDFPNSEVRTGFIKGLMKTYLGMEKTDTQVGFALKFWQALRKNDIELALREMKAYMAGLPYVEGFKQKLAEVSNAEGFYEWTFYIIFSMLNIYVRTQVKCIKGRIDILIKMPDTIYVMELKLHGTPLSALKHIESGDYAVPYSTDGRKVVKVGIRFDMTKLAVRDWKIKME
ncbi:MAG: ATP-binding protein [Paludibacteraceae bacterium]|nr:ATP-binding protein [Paludibacteraceae bacterium]